MKWRFLILIILSSFFLNYLPQEVHALVPRCQNAVVANLPLSVGQRPTLSGQMVDAGNSNQPLPNRKIAVDLYKGDTRISTASECVTTGADGSFNLQLQTSIPLLPQPADFRLRMREAASTAGCTSTAIPINGCADVNIGSVTPSCPHLGISVPDSGTIQLGARMNVIITGQTQSATQYKAEIAMGGTPLSFIGQTANNGGTITLGGNTPTAASPLTGTIKIFEGPNLCRQYNNYQIGITLATATPVPTSTIREIMCSNGHGLVGLSAPHPFPTGTSSVTFSFPNLVGGSYRMMVQDDFPSWNWYEACAPNASNGAPTGRFIQTGSNSRFECTYTDPQAFTQVRGFQLQFDDAGTWKDVPQYARCEWRPYDSPTCSLRITHQDLPTSNPGYREQAVVTLTGSGIPIGTRAIFKRVSDNAVLKTIEMLGTQTTLNEVIQNVRRNERYKLEVYEDIPLGSRLVDGCAIEYLVPPIGAPTTNPNMSPAPIPTVYIPAGRAYQVCKSLCESITDPNWKNECRKIDGRLPEEIPGIGRIQLWSGTNIDTIFGRRNANYQANIRAFMERHKDKHLDVIGCVECFVNGGAYTAIGCIETNPQLFIARVFSIAIPLMGGIILLGFLKIGFSIITSGGDPKKMEENRNLATSLIGGALFVLGSTILYSFIGGTILGIPGFS